MLYLVLVELFIFESLPVGPVITEDEFIFGQFGPMVFTLG